MTLDDLYDKFVTARAKWVVDTTWEDANSSNLPNARIDPMTVVAETDFMLNHDPSFAHGVVGSLYEKMDQAARLYLVARNDGMKAATLWKLSQP